VRAVLLTITLSGFFAARLPAPVALPAARSAPGSPAGERRGDLAEYVALNESEKRYGEYADSRETLALKLAQLSHVNESRRRHGAGPLRLDILACRVANRAAAEACAGSYRGHWNLRGEKPYHRYAFAGGVDHVTENAASIRSSSPFESSSRSLASLMRKAHDGFMSETPPNDGHERTVVDRFHNFLGVGACLKGNDFRYYEEYVDRYIEFMEVRREVSPGERFHTVVKPLSDVLYLHMVAAYHEPVPTPMTPAQVNGMGSYADFSGERARLLSPWDLRAFRENGVYALPLEFDKPGLYYLHMYLDDREYTQGTATTRGKIQASGLVIRCR
jgi:uncharacterized protein YkwD